MVLVRGFPTDAAVFTETGASPTTAWCDTRRCAPTALCVGSNCKGVNGRDAANFDGTHLAEMIFGYEVSSLDKIKFRTQQQAVIHLLFVEDTRFFRHDFADKLSHFKKLNFL